MFLIGNGFDLAHGLKTKYSDFLLWYINKTVRSYDPLRSNIFEDDLVILDGGGYKVDEFYSLESFKYFVGKGRISFNCKYTFFNRILSQSSDFKWVDIEYEYYSALLYIYKRNEKHTMGKNDIESEVRKLNNCFELIKNQLIEYLQTIKITAYSDQIENRFRNEFKKHLSMRYYFWFLITQRLSSHI